MKSLPVYFFTLIFGLLFLAVPVSAQQEATPTAEPEEEVFDFEKAYKDYIFIYEVYKQAHSDYLLAKSQYSQAKTLASQTKARDATVKMLQARDDVVITYLTMLRLKLLEAEGVSDVDKNGLFTRLDSEILWYQNNRVQIPSAGTLNDLAADSAEAAEHFDLVEPLVYEVLATIPVGQVEVFKQELNQILNNIKTKTQEVRLKGDYDTQIIERWIIETENKITRALEKQVAAQSAVFKFQTTDQKSIRKPDYLSEYNNIISLLQESNQLLREASSYMREIVKHFKFVDYQVEPTNNE